MSQREVRLNPFEWTADWRRPATGAKFVAIMVAISVFMIAIQVLLYATGAFVVEIFEAFDSAKQLQRVGVTVAAIVLPVLVVAGAVVIGAYKLFGVFQSRVRSISDILEKLDSEDEHEDIDDEKTRSELGGAALNLHVIMTIILLHLIWHLIIEYNFSTNTAILDHGASFSLLVFFHPVVLTYFATIALMPFWIGAFWLAMAEKGAEETTDTRGSWIEGGIPFVLCYAILALVLAPVLALSP